MCMLCNSKEFVDCVVDRDYTILHLNKEELDMGILGTFINELNIIMDGEEREIKMESCISLNNNPDICNVTQMTIKYCPFCGEELDF